MKRYILIEVEAEEPWLPTANELRSDIRSAWGTTCVRAADVTEDVNVATIGIPGGVSGITMRLAVAKLGD